MFRSFSRWLTSPRSVPVLRKHPLGVEQLEKREVPAAVVSKTWFQPVTSGVARTVSAQIQVVNQGKAVQASKDDWLIQLTPTASQRAGSPAGAAALFKAAPFRVQVVEGLGQVGALRVRTTGATFQVAQTWFARNPALVARAQPNLLVKAAAVPNDPRFREQWALNNIGQTGGSVDADIDGPEAWDRARGSRGVVVAVIDSGIDYTHPDLAANMWRNPREIPGNGVDDDRNGFADDVYGFDFANGDANPMDDNGHGTHVAGTIAAVGNNRVGVTGVAWNSSVMALKFLGADNTGTIANALRALNYATMMKSQFGVNIVATNNSWGGGDFSQQFMDAITASGNANILFIAAAMNGGADRIGDNNDFAPTYPASYPNANIISVAATDHLDRLASFSNFGPQSVDVAAPGVAVLSTLPGRNYGSYSGTSMATPHVSGLAALARSLVPNASAAAIRNAILAGVDPRESLTGLIATGGRINSRRTLDLLAPPALPPSLTINDVSVLEGNAGVFANFAVSLSAPSSQSVTVRFATANNSAVAPADYQNTTGTLTFSPGERTKFIIVPITGDVLLEGDEAFFVHLSSPTNAVIGRGTGTGVIRNDDRLTGPNQLGAVRTDGARGGLDWYLDLNKDGTFAERVMPFGLVGDVPVSGDWNGDGRTDLGAVRSNSVRGGLDWYLDLNNDGVFAERVMHFGLLGDIPVVGDWNGDGRSDLGAVRTNTARGGLDWYLDLNDDGVFAERVMYFGLLGDIPVVGDWNGDRQSDLGAVRTNTVRGGLDWYLDLNNDGVLAERILGYGLLGDEPVVGDWNGDGRSDLGAVRPNLVRGGLDWYLDLNDDGNLAELIVEYGLLGDKTRVGRW